MQATSSRTRVWDLPTRIFHWTLAAAVIGSLVSAKIGGNAMTWHFRLGYLVLALLAFRLVWGLVGGYWSRFASFAHGPGRDWRYLRGRGHPADAPLDAGHSPIGSYSVFAMLAVLLVQAGTGLVADDEIANVGPLNRLVASVTAALATSWHRQVGQWLVIGLVTLHAVAIAYYYFARRVDLVRPMWHGDKWLAPATPASADTWRERVVGLLIFALAAALVGWVVTRGG